MPLITLDTVKNITISEEIPIIPNPHALAYLPVGIFEIASAIRQMELKKFPDPLQADVFCFHYEGYFIACNFHWFALSLVNYLRLVALVEVLSKNGWPIYTLNNPEQKKVIKKHCREYVREIVPEVLTWRNKVGAHFAATDPFDGDNVGTLEASLMQPVSYAKPYYRANGLTYSRGDQSSEIPSWAITETYDNLCDRFFSDRFGVRAKLPPFPDPIEH